MTHHSLSKDELLRWRLATGDQGNTIAAETVSVDGFSRVRTTSGQGEKVAVSKALHHRHCYVNSLDVRVLLNFGSSVAAESLRSRVVTTGEVT